MEPPPKKLVPFNFTNDSLSLPRNEHPHYCVVALPMAEITAPFFPVHFAHPGLLQMMNSSSVANSPSPM